MKELVNVALVGLGQIGNYFYNEIKIEVKTGKFRIVISAKNKIKKKI